VRNLNSSDRGFTVIDIKAKGLAVEHTHLAPAPVIAPPLPLPPLSEAGAPVRPSAARPPKLESVRNASELQVGPVRVSGMLSVPSVPVPATGRA
jgi:hypothetical protein